MDGAFLKHESMPANFVPAGLRREDPLLYYGLLRDQAKWLHQHRNVQVQNVPPNEAQELKRHFESQQHPGIHRIYTDFDRNRLHISTNATAFTEVQQWVKKEASRSPVNCKPVVPTGPAAQSDSSRGKSVYSKKFTTRTTNSDGSFDSTIKTAKPNAWYKTRPVPLIIDFSADAELFPPMPSKVAQPGDAPTATSKVSLTDDTTIKTAIISATQEIEERYEKKLQDITNRFNAKISKLEATLLKFETMDSKLDLLLQRMSTTDQGGYHTAASTPTRKTKRRDMKATPNVLRTFEIRQEHPLRNVYESNTYGPLATQDDDSNDMDYHNASDRDDMSATSATRAEGRSN